MRVVRFAIAFALISVVSMQGQVALKPTTVNLRVVDTTFAELVDTIARTTALDIRLDDTVGEEARNLKVEHIVFRDASLESVLTFLTDRSGLTFEVIDEKTVRIRAKP
jgi:hypothetical protein